MIIFLLQNHNNYSILEHIKGELSMQNLNIIISAHNQAEYVKLSLQSIRMFADIESLSVILIDNNSTDGLQQWAMGQTDITYIFNDDENMPYGQMINQIHHMLSLQGDLLLLDPHFMLTPSCLSRMITTLYEKNDIGAVGPMSNTFTYYQKTEEFSDYEKAVLGAQQLLKNDNQRVMTLAPSAFMIREDAFKQLGNFDELIQTPTYTIRDYCFRMIQNDLLLKICKTALVWDARNIPSLVLQNSSDEKRLEDKWGMHYFNSVGNLHVINVIKHNPSDSMNILEIGCDCGATLLEIKNIYPNANVYGSELNERAAQIASHFATTTVNNIEETNLPYPEAMFDYIILGDVLEHLHNPQKTLQYCKTFLKDTGHIIASIPNLMHISVMEDLLKGYFTYTETGLLDKTHIHFFTYHEIVKIFQSSGYQITDMDNVVLPITEEQTSLLKQLSNIYNTPALMFKTFQYVLCAKKSNF